MEGLPSALGDGGQVLDGDVLVDRGVHPGERRQRGHVGRPGVATTVVAWYQGRTPTGSRATSSALAVLSACDEDPCRILNGSSP